MRLIYIIAITCSLLMACNTSSLSDTVIGKWQFHKILTAKPTKYSSYSNEEKAKYDNETNANLKLQLDQRKNNIYEFYEDSVEVSNTDYNSKMKNKYSVNNEKNYIIIHLTEFEQDTLKIESFTKDELIIVKKNDIDNGDYVIQRTLLKKLK